MIIAGLTKQPGETLKQRLDYAYWLNGATIEEVIVAVDPVDTLGVVTAVVANDTAVDVFLSGGADATNYTVTLSVVVSDTQVREDELKLSVREIH